MLLCAVDHDAVKLDDAAWSRLSYVGLQPTYAEPPEAQYLELRNCACHSTLCREVKP